MTFIPRENVAGLQPIATTSTTKQHGLGRIIRADDHTTGGAEFIYLEGVASTVVGSIINYDDSFQTALETTTLNKPRPNAVAMSANIAGQYGWYMISGLAAVAKANTVSFAKGTPVAAAAGLAVAVATGLQIGGAFVSVVASAKSNVTSVNIMLNRPEGPRN